MDIKKGDIVILERVGFQMSGRVQVVQEDMIAVHCPLDSLTRIFKKGFFGGYGASGGWIVVLGYDYKMSSFDSF